MILTDPLFSVIVRSVAVAGWLLICLRVGHAVVRHVERRLTFVVMAVGGTLGALGLLCSGIAQAQRVGAIPQLFNSDVLVFGANVGAGAMLAGALVVVTHYRPPQEARHD